MKTHRPFLSTLMFFTASGVLMGSDKEDRSQKSDKNHFDHFCSILVKEDFFFFLQAQQHGCRFLFGWWRAPLRLWRQQFLTNLQPGAAACTSYDGTICNKYYGLLRVSISSLWFNDAAELDWHSTEMTENVRLDALQWSELQCDSLRVRERNPLQWQELRTNTGWGRRTAKVLNEATDPHLYDSMWLHDRIL